MPSKPKYGVPLKNVNAKVPEDDVAGWRKFIYAHRENGIPNGNTNKNIGNINNNIRITKAFKILYKILHEFSECPWVSYNEFSTKRFNPELQQFWVDILTRHGLTETNNIVDTVLKEIGGID